MKWSELIAALADCGGLRTPGAVETALREAAAAPERDFRQLIDLVRSAIGAVVYPSKPVGERWISLEAIYADRAIVELAGRKYQYGYTVTATPSGDQVTLAAPVEVIETYVPTVPADKTVVREAVAVAVASDQAFREAQDGAIEVTLIRAGRSINGNYYPDATLREAAPMFEGVRVFAKSDDQHVAGKGKDVRNLIGGIYSVRFVEGKVPDTGTLVGTFKALDPTDTAVVKMTEAVKRGMQGLMGLSIDATARTKRRKEGTETLREAVKFTKVHSVDLIVEPGAGGGLDRLTEAAADHTIPNEEGTAMPLWKQRMLEAIKAKDPAKHAAINLATISDDEVVNLHEAVCGPLVPPAGQQRMTEAVDDKAPVTRADLQVFTLRGAARERIAGSKLPQAAKDRLQAQIATAGADRLTEAAVGDLIKAEGDYIARFTESGTVRVPDFVRGTSSEQDRPAAIREMLDAFFDPAHKNHRSVHSFRECYIEITGDRRVTGDVRDVDMSRLAESLGVMRESVSSSTWADALGDSITRRMQAVYTGLTNLDTWKKVATYGPVNDFRTQERVRIGGYGNLPAVAQGSAYTALTSPGDDKATYAVTKRGGTEDVTLEAIGKINYQHGLGEIQFGDLVLDSSLSAAEKAEWWYDPAEVGTVEAGKIWRPWPVDPASLRYNTVTNFYLPVDPEILGLDPVRLPQDGRVPKHRKGRVVVIGHNASLAPATYAASDVIDLGRERVTHVWLHDANGELIDTGFEATEEDLNAGEVRVIDVTGWAQPVTVEHRIQEMRQVTDLQISGDMQLNFPLSYDFPAGSVVSSALLWGNTFARFVGVWDQQSWDGITWSDTTVGNPAPATYNIAANPIVVSNAGALSERYAWRYTTTESFDFIGEFSGFLGNGSKNVDHEPGNPFAPATKLLSLKAAGWGGGWAPGNVLFGRMVAAMQSFVAIRTVQPSIAPATDYSFDLLTGGDIDRPPSV